MAFDKIVDSAKLEADLTTVADAIRTKGGTVEQLAFPEGFKTAIDGIQAGGGGGQELADSIIDGSVTEITSNASSVWSHAFYQRKGLVSASFPLATSIGYNAFFQCKAMSSISIPAVTRIGGHAFDSCNSLTVVEIPQAVEVEEAAFYFCDALTTISLPSATSLGEYVFRFCNNLMSVNIPALVSIGSGAFLDCWKLQSVSFPLVTSIGSSAFYRCQEMTSASFPSATSAAGRAFDSCYKLAELRLEGPKFCSATGNLYLNSTCKIYVPAALIKQYKTATNWSQHANQFVPVGAFLPAIPSKVVITDTSDTYTVTASYVNFTHGEVKAALNYDASKLLVTAQVVPDAETPGSGAVQLTIKALTAPAEMETNTVSVTVSDDADSFTQKFSVKVIKSVEDPVVRVEPIEGAANGFALNSAGYYESQNKGKNSSYALCKIVYNTFGLYHLYLDCINEGELNYDFGLLSNPGVTLSSSNSADSSGVFHSFKGKASKAVQVVDYGVLPTGENFITAKFRKDDSGNSGNDSLQFKVRMEL